MQGWRLQCLPGAPCAPTRAGTAAPAPEEPELAEETENLPCPLGFCLFAGLWGWVSPLQRRVKLQGRCNTLGCVLQQVSDPSPRRLLVVAQVLLLERACVSRLLQPRPRRLPPALLCRALRAAGGG